MKNPQQTKAQAVSLTTLLLQMGGMVAGLLIDPWYFVMAGAGYLVDFFYFKSWKARFNKTNESMSAWYSLAKMLFSLGVSLVIASALGWLTAVELPFMLAVIGGGVAVVAGFVGGVYAGSFPGGVMSGDNKPVPVSVKRADALTSRLQTQTSQDPFTAAAPSSPSLDSLNTPSPSPSSSPSGVTPDAKGDPLVGLLGRLVDSCSSIQMKTCPEGATELPQESGGWNILSVLQRGQQTPAELATYLSKTGPLGATRIGYVFNDQARFNKAVETLAEERNVHCIARAIGLKGFYSYTFKEAPTKAFAPTSPGGVSQTLFNSAGAPAPGKGDGRATKSANGLKPPVR